MDLKINDYLINEDEATSEQYISVCRANCLTDVYNLNTRRLVYHENYSAVSVELEAAILIENLGNFDSFEEFQEAYPEYFI